ncbi:hypothetical protein [Halogranum rubrum]|uniref:hypothetical protein n=1 Tax=Halogranum rubrum TaxID=553466 RepID=UPI0006779C65|nr:hypothetical protein [Halogranum salarium]
MITLQDTVDDLYEKAHVENKTSSSARLDTLTKFCQEQLSDRGIRDTEENVNLDAFVRSKNWDIASRTGESPQIAISTKSVLNNLSGTIPNRTDELLGEVTDLQMRYPDVVTGYVVIVDTADTADEPNRSRWAQKLERRIDRLSGRRPPAWGRGLVESACVVKTNLAGPGDAQLLSDPGDMHDFFDEIVKQYRERFESGQQTLS